MSTINKDLSTQVDEYFEQYFVADDDLPRQALAYCDSLALPKINVSPSFGKFLNLLIKVSGVKRVLEIGSLGGYSTVWMGLALPADGELISLEFDTRYIPVAQHNLQQSGLAGKAHILGGYAEETLPQLIKTNPEPFDLIFIDANKEKNPLYLDYSLQLTKPGSMIICDNVVRDGQVVQIDPKGPNIKGIQAFTKAVAANPKLEATTMQTVGSKGWDGFTLVRVKA